jgi:chitin-binding protein
VIARFFDANGEVAAMRTEMTIFCRTGDATSGLTIWRRKLTPRRAQMRVGVREAAVKSARSMGPTDFRQRGEHVKIGSDFYEEQKAQVNETIAVSGLQYSKIEQVMPRSPSI